MPTAGTITYADPKALIRGSLDLLEPPKRERVDEYTAKHRWVTNPDGGVMQWSHDLTPYLIEPMRCLTGDRHVTVAIAGPGQSGKTSAGQNWLLHSVGSNPRSMLWYMQTGKALDAYVKAQIDPMVEGHRIMSERIGKRPVDNSMHFKRFRGMYVEFLEATRNNLISKTAPNILADEIDAYPSEFGDVKALLDIRRQRFGRQSKLLMVSHPDRARGPRPERDWTEGIMAVYGDSDMRVWYWPCPVCGSWSTPVPLPGHLFMPLNYPDGGTLDEIERGAFLECPVNGCHIRNDQRFEMNLRAARSPFGGWIGRGQSIDQHGKVDGELLHHDTAGFWIVGAMSPFVFGGIGGLARARVKAEREREIDEESTTIKEVMVKQWGFCYSDAGAAGSVDANMLAERTEPMLKRGKVPPFVRFLTAYSDVQLTSFEWIVRGWGEYGESAVIDRGRLNGDPPTAPEDWDKLFKTIFIDATYELDDGSGRRMRIKGAGFDSQGTAGVTQQAYSAWTRFRRKNLIASVGKVGGRDVFSIIPTQGRSTPNAAKLDVTYPDTKKKANAKFGKGNVPVAQFNPNLYKDDLMGQLLRAEPGSLYVHFGEWLLGPLRNADDPRFPIKEPPHVFFEQVTAEKRDAKGRWEKAYSTVRNEGLDLMVGSHVIAHLHGLSRINWQKPPPWAAPWEGNTMIVAPTKPAMTEQQAQPLTPGVPARTPGVVTVQVMPSTTGKTKRRLA